MLPAVVRQGDDGEQCSVHDARAAARASSRNARLDIEAGETLCQRSLLPLQVLLLRLQLQPVGLRGAASDWDKAGAGTVTQCFARVVRQRQPVGPCIAAPPQDKEGADVPHDASLEWLAG